MSPRTFAPQHRARPGRRRGLSLIEVLSAIFVLSIGLLGVLSVIPYGIYQVKRASIADHGTSLLRSARADLAVRGWDRPDAQFLIEGEQKTKPLDDPSWNPSTVGNPLRPIDVNSDYVGAIQTTDFLDTPDAGTSYYRVDKNGTHLSDYVYYGLPNQPAAIIHRAFFDAVNPTSSNSDATVDLNYQAIDCTRPIVVDPMTDYDDRSFINPYRYPYPTTDQLAAFYVSVGTETTPLDGSGNPFSHPANAASIIRRVDPFVLKYVEDLFLGSEDLLYTQGTKNMRSEEATRTAMMIPPNADVPMSRGDYSWFFMYTADLDTYTPTGSFVDPRITLNDIPLAQVGFHVDVLTSFQRTPDITGTAIEERRERIFYDTDTKNVNIDFRTARGGMVTITAHEGQSLDTKDTRYLLLLGPSDTPFPNNFSFTGVRRKIGLWYRILSKTEHGNTATFLLDGDPFPDCWDDPDFWPTPPYTAADFPPPLQAVIIQGVVNHHRFDTPARSTRFP